MKKRTNPDIGRIKCPITGELAPLRRYSTGQRLGYWMSSAGKIAPNLEAGQLYIWQHAEFFDETDRGQIGSWLISRGLNLPGSENATAGSQNKAPRSENSGNPDDFHRVPENRPHQINSDEDLQVTRIGGTPEPESPSERKSEQQTGFWDFFVKDDE